MRPRSGAHRRELVVDRPARVGVPLGLLRERLARLGWERPGPREIAPAALSARARAGPYPWLFCTAGDAWRFSAFENRVLDVSLGP